MQPLGDYESPLYICIHIRVRAWPTEVSSSHGALSFEARGPKKQNTEQAQALPSSLSRIIQSRARFCAQCMHIKEYKNKIKNREEEKEDYICIYIYKQEYWPTLLKGVYANIIRVEKIEGRGSKHKPKESIKNNIMRVEKRRTKNTEDKWK